MCFFNLTHVTHEYIMCEMYQFGSTPLILAAREGHLPVVDYLLEKGAAVEAIDEVSDVS